MGRGIRGSPRTAVVLHSPWPDRGSPLAPGKLQHGRVQSGGQDPVGDPCPAGCMGPGAAGCCWGSVPAVPGLAAPGLAEGVSARRGDTIKDGNLLIQALPALQRESGTVFFTTS